MRAHTAHTPGTASTIRRRPAARDRHRFRWRWRWRLAAHIAAVCLVAVLLPASEHQPAAAAPLAPAPAESALAVPAPAVPALAESALAVSAPAVPALAVSATYVTADGLVAYAAIPGYPSLPNPLQALSELEEQLNELREAFTLVIDEVLVPGLIVDLDGESLDIVQQSLELAGAVPLVGNYADLTNAGISVARGNYGEAVLHVAMALPVAGIVVFAVVRVARTAKRVWKIHKATKFDIAVDGSGRARRTGVRVAETPDLGPSFTYTPVDGRIVKMEGLVPTGPSRKLPGLSSKTKAELKNEVGIPRSEHKAYTIDHGVPGSWGGANHESNLLVLFKGANSKKSSFENKLRSLAQDKGDEIYFVVEPKGGVGRRPDYVMLRYRINDGPMYSVKIPNDASAKHVKVPDSLIKGGGSVVRGPGLTAVDVGTGAAAVVGAAAGLAVSTADDGGRRNGEGSRSVSLSLGGPVTGATYHQHCEGNPHCYWLDIDLHGDFGPGPHHYQCFTVGGWTRSDGTHTTEPWVDWTNSASPDRQCLEWLVGEQVYVVVDGVRSNNLTWSPPPDF